MVESPTIYIFIVKKLEFIQLFDGFKPLLDKKKAKAMPSLCVG
ncbi:hypothetical protein [Vibrio vulnificus YJ016]|uniref:Uncharacterized protein n=1 Tax=Vibrio vulnificus (strain YJ016) TaxID=196600 RepID=Q7MF84_VIBVY|nr:hypothetical protein VVMO6_03391 [Vibrio vulnificus MO6-24/O]BAC96462.1 hypothetical protein [Vibrio vulnificus YJ016]